jgi:hypothetical protein
LPILELFFDLVFVFAVSQLSHHLLAHLSWCGAAETLVMLVAILTVWTYTSWAATMISADQSRTRWMIADHRNRDRRGFYDADGSSHRRVRPLRNSRALGAQLRAFPYAYPAHLE